MKPHTSVTEVAGSRDGSLSDEQHAAVAEIMKTWRDAIDPLNKKLDMMIQALLGDDYGVEIDITINVVRGSTRKVA